MPPTFASRALSSSFLLLAAASAPSQTLPPASPTATPAVEARQSASAPAGHAQILFNNGLLSVYAANSSLNQILRDISHVTGMTITGGVTDERVFGSYGPADTGAVLSTLLDGTGSNMVLLENRDNSPRELVLTPRHGGPSPPSPDAFHDPEPPRNRPPQVPAPPQQMPDSPQTPPSPQQPPQQQYVPVAPDASQNPTTPDTTTQQSPNGVKTPQQIYEQLMKLQQQQATPQTPH